MSRKIEIGSQRYTQVTCLDEPGPGGACHEYRVEDVSRPSRFFAGIVFQHGPVLENPINGCFMEDLLAVVIDRLQHFQKGDYACSENAYALENIEEALHWLNKRTKGREERGVKGKSVV